VLLAVSLASTDALTLAVAEADDDIDALSVAEMDGEQLDDTETVVDAVSMSVGCARHALNAARVTAIARKPPPPPPPRRRWHAPRVAASAAARARHGCQAADAVISYASAAH